MSEVPGGRKRMSPWLVGCLAGCGLAVLVAGGAIGAGVWYVRGLTGRFDESVSVGQELESRFGAAEKFVPASDGAIPPQRIEAFLAVRAAMAPQRDRIKAAMAQLPISAAARDELESKRGFERIISVLGISRGALGLAPAIGEFFGARNKALLEQGMGLGEYEYIYLLSYGPWLRLATIDGRGEAPGAGANPSGPPSGAEEAGPFGMVGAELSERLHDHMRAMLRNQLKALPPGATGEFASALKQEIAKLDEDAARLPWQEGLPAATAGSLEPFRDRIVAAWSPRTHAFELAVSRKRGRFSYQAD